MSIKASASVFSRNFRKSFNQNKYQDLLGKVGENHSHLGWLPSQEMKYGRFIFSFGIACLAIGMFMEPSYFHETFGHARHPPQMDYIDFYTFGDEKTLNQKLIHRQHQEHQLENFISQFTDFE